jgi:hypothetical protein
MRRRHTKNAIPAKTNARAPKERTTGRITPILVLLVDFSEVVVWRAASKAPDVLDAETREEDEEDEDEDEDEDEEAEADDVDDDIVLEGKAEVEDVVSEEMTGGVVGIVEVAGVVAATIVSEETTAIEVAPIASVAVGCKYTELSAASVSTVAAAVSAAASGVADHGVYMPSL